MSLVLSYSEVVQVGLRIVSSADLNAFCARATSKPVIGERLEDLRVVMHEQFSGPSLRRCLSLVPNLVDLDLLLSDPHIPELLSGVVLPDLRFFRTNIAHHALLAFFAAHEKISVLMLDACGAGDGHACPLAATSLPHLKCITGPAPCVPHLVNDDVSRLTMTSPIDTCCTSLILRSIRLPSLCTLTVEFRADDHDMLPSIVASCPHIRKLKLLEMPSGLRRRRSTRRAWNDSTTWSKTLLSLPLLEELMLRTASTVVRRSACEGEERKAFMRWISGLRSSSRGQPNYHPILYHIGVWYRADDHDRGVITHWSRHAGQWSRCGVILSPPEGYDFV